MAMAAFSSSTIFGTCIRNGARQLNVCGSVLLNQHRGKTTTAPTLNKPMLASSSATIVPPAEFFNRIVNAYGTTNPSSSSSSFASHFRRMSTVAVADLPQLQYTLSEEQLKTWDQDGMLHIQDAIPTEWIKQLPSMATELKELDSNGGEWIKHYELVGDGTEEKQMCRVENFCKHLPLWKELCLGIVQDLVGQALRERAVLFKDKVNFKGPGGGGFLCHQDATAYSTEDLASRHVSVLVAVDEATEANGCLKVAPGTHNMGVFKNIKGVVDPEIQDSMEWVDVLAKPGDLVLFDSFLPHWSEGNTTDGWRRSGYLTYNKLSEGDLHEAYYKRKAEVWASGEGGTISINHDFGGKIAKE